MATSDADSFLRRTLKPAKRSPRSASVTRNPRSGSCSAATPAIRSACEAGFPRFVGLYFVPQTLKMKTIRNDPALNRRGGAIFMGKAIVPAAMAGCSGTFSEFAVAAPAVAVVLQTLSTFPRTEMCDAQACASAPRLVAS